MTVSVILIIFATILTAIVALVYVTWFYVSRSVKECKPERLSKYPPISIVFPAYNEIKVIKGRIRNIVQCNYPSELEVVVVDDASEDQTGAAAWEYLTKAGVCVNVIWNDKRSGVNFSMAKGIMAAKNEIIVCTDADVHFDKNALMVLVEKLMSDPDIGAVTGDLQPYTGTETTKKSEVAYRSIYGKICEWESDVASTFCFNGALYAIKKSASPTFDIKDGAYDAGIAFAVIKNGYKAVYVSAAKVFENIPDELSSQFRQKIRRAARLIKTTWNGRDVMSPEYGKFGRIIFPLRFAAFLIVPIAFFKATLCWIYILSSINIIFLPVMVGAFLLAAISGAWRSNLVSTFILHQVYLFVGLLIALKGGVHTWKLTERKA